MQPSPPDAQTVADAPFQLPSQETPGEAVPHQPKLPVVLVPGLNCTPALFGPQLPALCAGRLARVGDHTRHDRDHSAACPGEQGSGGEECHGAYL